MVGYLRREGEGRGREGREGWEGKGRKGKGGKGPKGMEGKGRKGKGRKFLLTQHVKYTTRVTLDYTFDFQFAKPGIMYLIFNTRMHCIY